jgi:hypothetical protein
MSDALKQRWWEYHRENPKVYELFEKFTLDVIGRGHKNYSANAVFERIRWHTDVEVEEEGEFKLSNNHRAYYARYFHWKHPEFDGFFRTKKVEGDKL